MGSVRDKFNKTVAAATLASYLLVGAVGFWNTLDQFFQYGTNPWVFKNWKSTTPSPSRVVWTQQKHYPSTAKDEVQAPAVVSHQPDDVWQESFVVAPGPSITEKASGFSHQHIPRAPPLS